MNAPRLSLEQASQRRLGKRVFRQLKVLNSAPEHSLFGEFLDVDDLGGKQNAGRARGVRSGDFDARRLVEPMAASEAKAAARNVFAKNDTVVGTGLANTRGEVHSYAGMLALPLKRPWRGTRLGRLNGLRGNNGGPGQIRNVRSLFGSLPPER